ncbi:MAG: phosphopyruvate hydratase [Candidatus Pacebacteria bacterium]|nr:phosphopyruvate hydratase [Candidatus Paceibacterota bacterium]
MKIKSISSYEILASGGYPTLETRVELESGEVGVASIPYGVSAGSHEATVLLDGDMSRYNGKGMLKAIANVNDIIAPEIIGMEGNDQAAIDRKMIELDGTENKAKLGGNAILSVSLAVAKAMANHKKVGLYEHVKEVFEIDNNFTTLPHPMMVVIEGGKHADDTTDLQEYCISSISADSVKEGVRHVIESYHALKKILKKNNLSTNVGNEGAFAPNGIPSNEAPFEYIVEAIKAAGYTPGEDLAISMDAAATEFYKDGKYDLALENKQLTSDEIIAYYEEWFKKYPIATFEDSHDEDDWEAWPKMLKLCEKYHVELIGDDLTVTNIKRLQMAIDKKAISSILIKLNQIGTLTETVQTCLLAREHNMMTVFSHRGGGETNDTAMVDVAVAVGSSYIKVGPTRGERISKYNRLMEIEREL